MRKARLSLMIVASLVIVGACSRSGGVPGKINGRIDLAPALAAALKPDDTLYIIVKEPTEGGKVSPPVAVKRVKNPKFPLRYEIGPEDAPIPGRLREGTSYVVTARVARGGNTMAKPGDFGGEPVKKQARLGDGSVDINLDRQL